MVHFKYFVDIDQFFNCLKKTMYYEETTKEK